MAGSLPLKNDVQLVTQFPQSRRQALDVLSAVESVLPISDSEVTCGPMTRPATLNQQCNVIVELDGLQQQQQQHTYYYWYSITDSLFHSRLKSFLICKSSLPHPFLFLLQDSLYGFPRLFTVTFEHIRLFTFLFFSVFTLFQLSVPCGRLS